MLKIKLLQELKLTNSGLQGHLTRAEVTLPAVGTLRSSHHIPRPAEGNEDAAQGS